MSMPAAAAEAPAWPGAADPAVHHAEPCRTSQQPAFDKLRMDESPESGHEPIFTPHGPATASLGTAFHDEHAGYATGPAGLHNTGCLGTLSKWTFDAADVDIHQGQVLGAGACGVVFRATINRSALVAVKKLRPGAPATAIADMRAEMIAATKLPLHPNLSALVGVCCAASEDPAILWELIDGHSLSCLYAAKRSSDASWRPTTRSCLSWCRQIFSALACLHQHGLVHRDVKPDNCMVASDLATVKLVDFGLCDSMSANDAQGIFRPPATGTTTEQQRNKMLLSGRAGSFRYMAPEIVLKPNEGYGAEVDVYSAALCSWFIAAGSAPFSNLHGEQVAELAARTRLRPLPCKGLKCAAFWRLVERAWNHDPVQRPQARVIEASLQELIDEHDAKAGTLAARCRSRLLRLISFPN